MSGLTTRRGAATSRPDRSLPEQTPGERAGRWNATRRGDLILSTVIVLAVAGPLLFTTSGFAGDFTNHLWLTWVAGRELVQSGHPGFFVSATGIGVFYPEFAFYGGSLYALTGALGEVLGGHPVLAFLIVSTLAIAACYTGALWLGHELGLRGWTAHAPALAVVTSAYFITNLYGRGAWTEFMAAAAIAPSIAAGVHLVRAPRWRPWPVVALSASVAIFSGSHNITLEWALTLGALDLFVLWLALGAPLRLPYRRLAMVGALSLAGALVNAWFLLPDLVYSKNTSIGSMPLGGGHVGPSFFDTLAVELYPFRHVPAQSGTPALYVQAPDWFLAWGLIAGVILLWRRSRNARPVVAQPRAARLSATRLSARLRDPRKVGARVNARLGGAWSAAVIAVAIDLMLIVFGPIWHIVPFPLNEIQEPYRIGTYVFYAVAGLVLVTALILQRASVQTPGPTVSTLRGALAVVTVVSLGLCLWQEWAPSTLTPNSDVNRGEALASVNIPPRSWYDPGAYLDAQAPIVEAGGGRVLILPPALVHGDHFAATMEVPPGREPIQTNIAGGSYVVHISGLERVGRNAAGYAVVRRPDGGSGPVHVVVEATRSTTTELGWILSLMAILAILATMIVTGLRGRRDSPEAV